MFNYFRSLKDNKWYFHLIDNNYEIILASSEGYSTKYGCMKGIASVKRNGNIESRFRLFTGNDERYYFSLFAKNGQCIGRSQGYATSTVRKKCLVNCMREIKRSKPIYKSHDNKKHPV